MSYVKPHKSCQDEGVGLRTVNQLADNQLDTKTALEVEHAVYAGHVEAKPFGSFAGSGVRIQRYGAQGGEHDTPKVARGEMIVVADAYFGVGAPSTIRVALHSGVCQDLVQLTTGSYFLPIVGLTDFYADVVLIGDVGTAIAQQQPSDPGTPPGINITTWAEAEQSDWFNSPVLAFELTDNLGFHVVVYGERAEPVAAVVAAPIKVSRFDRGPRPKFRVPR